MPKTNKEWEADYIVDKLAGRLMWMEPQITTVSKKRYTYVTAPIWPRIETLSEYITRRRAAENNNEDLGE